MVEGEGEGEDEDGSEGVPVAERKDKRKDRSNGSLTLIVTHPKPHSEPSLTLCPCLISTVMAYS